MSYSSHQPATSSRSAARRCRSRTSRQPANSWRSAGAPGDHLR